jgi:mycofactocin system FadH/OYE family oxidoreductase 1
VPPLLRPLAIGSHGGHVAPSVVQFGSIVTNLGRGRALTDDHTAFYERRAAGGAGIIVVEEAAVHPSDHPYEHSPLASRCAPGWAAIAAACDPHHTIVLAGLGHSGGQGSSHWHQQVMWAPSAVPEVNTRDVPKVMEANDIAAVIDGFASAAALAVASGLDGVEINAGQHSLVRQFLSGLSNMRADEYGSDRLRFAREVLAAVRKAVGRDRIVSLRLSVDELAPWAGIVADAGAQIAVELAPFVDIITVVRGSIFSVQATRPDGHEPPGFAIPLAAQVRDALRTAGHQTTVIAQGSIVDSLMAVDAIEQGHCDGVEMTRALLADAQLVRTEPVDVRPCILCNQTCQVRDNRNPVITCVADPRTGHERTEPDLDGEVSRAANGKPVVVIGGGVAGLEAARVAARRGAIVRLIEQRDALGGVVRNAARGAGRERLAAIADWLEQQCRQLGVEIATETLISADDLNHLRADHRVVIATGGSVGPLPFVVKDDAVVRHADEVLGTDGISSLPDGVIAVWDPIGGPIAISVAELLAANTRSVLFITPDLLVGEKLSLSGDLAPAQNRLAHAGVRIVKDALVREVAGGHVRLEDRWSGAMTEHTIGALIACGHRVPDTTLDPDELLLHAGDRIAPRGIHEAILEGRRRAIEAVR